MGEQTKTRDASCDVDIKGLTVMIKILKNMKGI